MKNVAGIIAPRGIFLTNLPMAAAKSPECSATAAPSITTISKPNGGNEVKVVGISTRKRLTFWLVSRLWACSVSPVNGWIALAPREAATIETITSIKISQMKMNDGSGSALPSRSILAR